MITAGNNNFKPARLALIVAVAISGTTQFVLARDYFNPGLVELDNPGASKADLFV